MSVNSIDSAATPTVDTPQERRNVALLQRIYAAYARGDAAPFFAAAAPDIRFGIAGPREHFRFAGIRHGLDWAKKVLAEIAEDFEWLAYEVRELIAERDWVIALAGGRLRDRATGALLEADLVDVIRLKDDCITDFVEYYDTTFLAKRTQALAKHAAKAKGRGRVKKAKAKPRPSAKRKTDKPKRRAAKRKPSHRR
jgi:ketosteroid isomerase-like protein